jgi:hypothetical protein
MLTTGWELTLGLCVQRWPADHHLRCHDTSGTGEYTQRVNQVGNPFAGITHKIQTNSNGGKFVQWLNPNCICRPCTQHLGQYRPQQPVWSGIRRHRSVGDQEHQVSNCDFPVNVQFRAEMFNLFNRINLASPAGTQLCNNYYSAWLCFRHQRIHDRLRQLLARHRAWRLITSER